MIEAEEATEEAREREDEASLGKSLVLAAGEDWMLLPPLTLGRAYGVVSCDDEGGMVRFPVNDISAVASSPVPVVEMVVVLWLAVSMLMFA